MQLVCFGTLFGFLITFSIIIYLAVFEAVGRDSQLAKVFSFIAAAFQLVSQTLPLYTGYQLLWPAEGAEEPKIMNFKQLLLVSRSYSLIVSLYWAIYCTLVYEHTVFMVVNVISTLLSLVSSCVHLFYCLKPDEPAVG